MQFQVECQIYTYILPLAAHKNRSPPMSTFDPEHLQSHFVCMRKPIFQFRRRQTDTTKSKWISTHQQLNRKRHQQQHHHQQQHISFELMQPRNGAVDMLLVDTRVSSVYSSGIFIAHISAFWLFRSILTSFPATFTAKLFLLFFIAFPLL